MQVSTFGINHPSFIVISSQSGKALISILFLAQVMYVRSKLFTGPFHFPASEFFNKKNAEPTRFRLIVQLTAQPHLKTNAETGLHDFTNRLIGKMSAYWCEQQCTQDLKKQDEEEVNDISYSNSQTLSTFSPIKIEGKTESSIQYIGRADLGLSHYFLIRRVNMFLIVNR